MSDQLIIPASGRSGKLHRGLLAPLRSQSHWQLSCSPPNTRCRTEMHSYLETLSIAKHEEPHPKCDDCEHPEGRRMQHVSLAACYGNPATSALFFSKRR